MSHHFKSGDLAILKSSEAEHLVGSVVELIEYVGSEEILTYKGIGYSNRTGHRFWWVKILSGQTYETPRGSVSEGFCAENRLIPLRGDFVPEQRKAKEAEPCA
ncbi:hypothetical protein GIV19_16870 [Pseudomonas syringae]|uniref:hypothetical protein n=1 Tax=Pseudomonas syringae TaxID=317 RepID=UPI001F405AA9|nr:hypothetical protein [Pseudomonas syringae]MCF5708956.1 hypothetical protein [Pseudomonas syringae]